MRWEDAGKKRPVIEGGKTHSSISRNEVVEQIEEEQKALRAAHPAQHFVPNIAQEKFFNHFKAPQKNGRYPYISLFSGGNGLGKSAMLAVLMAGCAFGLDELSEYFEDFRFFDDQHLRWKDRGANRPLHYRIITDSSNMEEAGELFLAIQEWWPAGRYTCSKDKGYYSTIVCDNGVLFDVRTHKQREGAHASANLDGIFCDEPYPEALHGEIVARTRTGGFIVYSLTPDRASDWMVDNIYDEADGEKIVVVYGSTWDNCKDIPGTRGHLSRDVIEGLITQWTKLGNDVLEARLYGKPYTGAGLILNNFVEDVHVIPPRVLSPEDPIYCVMDPHDVKLPAIGWFIQGRHGSEMIAEWPVEDYVRMGPTTLTFSQVAQAMKEIERGFGRGQVMYRFMDPNKGATRSGESGNTIQGAFSELGFDFVLVAIDSLDLGHNAVQAMLYYNKALPPTYPNIPSLRIWNTCRNAITAITRYRLKKKGYEGASLTARVEQKYKDYVDLCRYFCVSLQPWQSVTAMANYAESIFAGRVKK